MKRLRIHILQTELQGRISDLNLLGKYIHRQTIWLGLRLVDVLLYNIVI